MTSDEFNELPLMLTAEEVSRLLRIGRTSVYEAIRCGAIPSVKIGRTVSVPDIDSWKCSIRGPAKPSPTELLSATTPLPLMERSPVLRHSSDCDCYEAWVEKEQTREPYASRLEFLESLRLVPQRMSYEEIRRIAAWDRMLSKAAS